MFCGHCGKQNPDNAKSCSRCGKQFDKTQFTRENTERIRLNNTQRIPKPNLTEKIVPAIPASPKPKKSLILIISGSILLLLLIAVVALFNFKPWIDSENQNGLVELGSSAEIEENNENKVMSINDWQIYDGNWSAGGYTFSFEVDSDEIKCIMRDDKTILNSNAKLYSAQQSIKIEFDNKKYIELIPIKNRKLCIVIDGKQYDAIRTNSLPPELENQNINDSYIFYSASNGTQTTHDNIEIDDKTQRFWPLDKFAISTDDLERLTRNEIEIIKNEAYARHGYIFTNTKWQEFFEQFSWYEKNSSFTEDEFSKLERQNIDTIILYERENGWI